ncbi:hypothetical protein AAT18_11785 [Rhodococcus aetherivorans]|nr:hypothetical protein AAT18_11785 [Rhodococcus aetherivorans]
MYRTASRSTVLALGRFRRSGRAGPGLLGATRRGALVGAALIPHLLAQRPLDGLRHPEFSDTPFWAAASSARALICSTRRSVTRLMSPVTSSKVVAVPVVSVGASVCTSSTAALPSRRTVTTRSPSSFETSAAMSDSARSTARRAGAATAVARAAAVRRVCSSPSSAAATRDSVIASRYGSRFMTPY